MSLVDLYSCNPDLGSFQTAAVIDIAALTCASYCYLPGSFPNPEDLFAQNVGRLIGNLKNG
jgi:hypothetical protein